MIGTQNFQESFADLAINSNLPKKVEDSFLTKIDKLINFVPIERSLKKLYSSDKGRPSIPPIVMFKMMLLQQFNNLSDPELELFVADRISFRRFVGLSFEDSVPDETSMVRFRKRLIAAGYKDEFLEEVNRQLKQQNLIVRKATIIDATLVDSPTQRPSKSDEPTDKDASYTTKRGKIHYGFKAHVSVDAEHNLIEKTVLTTASVHDSNVFDELLPDDTQAVYADKAYADRERSAKLEKRGIKNGILDKAYRNHKLSDEQVEANKAKSKVRTNIERVFAHWKRWFSYTEVRYRGISKNALQLEFLAVAYNLKRTVAIIMG
jgi:IS5 family transposase